MAAKIQSRLIGRFVSGWAYMAVGTTILVWLTLLSTPFWERLLVDQAFTVEPGEAVELRSLTLNPAPIGALRVEVVARLSQSWVTYELQMRDSKGEVIASAVKDAWAESGNWFEDGESGIWNEKDTLTELDLRTQQSEPITFAIAVLDHTDAAGRDLDKPVQFTARIWRGAIDHRYLWAGTIATLLLSLLTLFVVPTTGKRVIYRSEPFYIIHDRGTLRKRDRLLRVVVTAKVANHAPAALDLKLTISPAEGNPIYAETSSAKVSFSKKDGKVLSARLAYTEFFLVTTPEPYDFEVELGSPSIIYHTTLQVYEDARTRIPVAASCLP